MKLFSHVFPIMANIGRPVGTLIYGQPQVLSRHLSHVLCPSAVPSGKFGDTLPPTWPQKAQHPPARGTAGAFSQGRTAPEQGREKPALQQESTREPSREKYRRQREGGSHRLETQDQWESKHQNGKDIPNPNIRG